MGYPDYLIHYNRNHDKKSGRFTYGDGDGDGIRDDHSNQKDKETVGEKVRKAVDTYDRVTEESRNRSLRNERYKVSKGDLRRQQAEISSKTTSAKTQEKMDKLALLREKQDTRNYINSAKRQSDAEKRAYRAEKAAQRFEDQMRKRQLRAERSEQRAITSEQNAYKRAERAARRQAKFDQNRSSYYSAKSQKKGRDAVIAFATGRPITAIMRAGSSLRSYNKSQDIINKYRDMTA